jgi:fatty-acyl-CoA synthase
MNTQFAAPDWIAHHARQQPDRIALTDVHSQRSFKYGEMNDRCARLAAFLRAGGVQRGDRVAVLCHNSTDVFEVQFACRKLGAIFVPLNWRLAQVEIEAIVENAAPRALIYGPEFAIIAKILQDKNLVEVLIGTRDGHPSAYEAGIADHVGLSKSEDVTHDDTFAIMYTSGTTGRPKGVIITHRMTVFSAVNGMMKAGVSESATGLTFLPLFHVGGLFLMANFIFHAGGHNILMRNFDAEQALLLLADPVHRISHAFGVPTNFAMMAALPSFATCDLSSVHCLTVGGAPSPMSLLNSYATKGVKLQQGWGMTETATLGTMLAASDAFDRIGSAGQAVMHAELSILDDDYTPVGTGSVGQLSIRGPTVTPGYWLQPEATASAFHDGWFLTGDAAYCDDDGYYFIVDRWKDMYISGGENVYPAEVESVLAGISGVAEAAVIGVLDQKWGEVGCAYVVLLRGADLSETDIREQCAAFLARFKLPKYIRIVESIPHSAAGKIAKPDLRGIFAREQMGSQ